MGETAAGGTMLRRWCAEVNPTDGVMLLTPASRPDGLEDWEAGPKSVPNVHLCASAGFPPLHCGGYVIRDRSISAPEYCHDSETCDWWT